MRRAAIIVLALAGLAAVLAAAGAGGGGGDGYRVDAIFDNSGFLVPGQDVKIAGAKVGVVDDIVLTRDRRARVQMTIDEGFAPFKDDADCTVQPQSLIGERFVQCAPGSADAEELPRSGPDDAPTVPVERTHSPVDVDLILATFSGSTRDKAALLLSSLGAGFAGRGEDLNQVIRRAAPALQQANRVQQVLNENRAELRTLLRSGDEVVGELAQRTREIERFVKSTGDLAETIGTREPELRRTLNDLPGLLAQLDPYLDEVTATALQGTPALDDLSEAAEPTRQLLTKVDTLASDSGPALAALRSTSARLRRLSPEAIPVARRLQAFAESARPTSVLVNDLLGSMKERGAIEGLFRFVYFAVAATARFDAKSHILGAYPIIGACNVYSTVPTAGCDAHFGAYDAANGNPTATRTGKRGDSKAERPKADATATPAPDRSPEPTRTAAPARTPRPPLVQLPKVGVDPVDKALGDVQDTVDGIVGDTQETTDGLLDFLLGK